MLNSTSLNENKLIYNLYYRVCLWYFFIKPYNNSKLVTSNYSCVCICENLNICIGTKQKNTISIIILFYDIEQKSIKYSYHNYYTHK